MKNTDIINGAKTALIDKNYESSLNLKPSLLINNNDNKLISVIINELETCQGFKFSSAFITLSGVQPLKEIFNYLEEKNIPGKIITTDYLYFTEPNAIKFLNNYENIEIKIFKHENNGFHTKGYLFKKNTGFTGIVGSANLTSNALNKNEEWNIGFTSTYDGELLDNLNNEFDKLWEKSHSFEEYFKEYESIYKKARTFNNLKQYTEDIKNELSPNKTTFIPNKMQNIFLEKMDSLIERGETKAMLVSATGTGKTYASAFEVRRRNPKKFLFVVHRFQIAKDAKETYQKVFNDSSIKFGILGGGKKEIDSDFLFATFDSLYSKERFKSFKPDEFDYIVVDEVHKAGAKTYSEIISYFKPKFLLGMTATPWRNDDKNIFELFDDNLVHEVTLQDALDEELVCPFHYYGITDLEIDGESIGDNFKDFNFLTSEMRVEYILKKSEEYGYSGEKIKALVFCSSVKEAKELAKKFTRRGHKSVALSGKDSNEYRFQTIDKLVDDRDTLEYIFTFDIFNEGIDIREINQVILARPTQSAIIFTQQLGRGLRIDKSKDFLVVLDFIGNYRNNYMIPLALSGINAFDKDNLREYVLKKTKIISGSSSISFDKIARTKILKSIDSPNLSMKLELKEKYHVFKRKFGKIPMICDIQEANEFNPNLIFKRAGFLNYFSFLQYCHKHDNEFKDLIKDNPLSLLSFISQELSNGFRPHELIILNLLKFNKYFTISKVEEILKEEYHLNNQIKQILSAINVLNLNFFKSNTGKYPKKINELIDKNNSANIFFKMDYEHLNDLYHKFEISNNFEECLKNSTFYKYFEDIINFSLNNYELKYKNHGLIKIHEKYTRREFCRIINWNYNDASTIYGYKEKDDICSIFVTYEKSEDINENLKYNDKFINNHIMNWESRDISRNNIKEKSEKQLIEKFINYNKNNVDFHLFVQKSDKDDDFYYLGNVTPKECMYPEENEPQIYKFKLYLDSPLPNDLYNYFTTALYHEV